MKKPLAIWVTDTHLHESTISVNFLIFKQIIELCKELNVKHILHGGDIFTSRKGQPEIVLNAFKSIIDQLAQDGLKIISIAGNHDKTDYTKETSFLDAFDGHPAFEVVSPYGQLGYGDLLISFLPYFDEDLTYMDYLKQINVSESNRNILLTHAAITGVKNNGGDKIKNIVTQSSFDKFDLVLVGHYHNRQIIGSKNHIVYTGSAYQANFGEDLDKGCTIIYDDGSYEFKQLDFPQYVSIDIGVGDLNASLIEVVKNAKVQDADVKIKFNIQGNLEDKEKALIIELEKEGVKINCIKESFEPISVIQSEDIQVGSIMDEFDEWSKGKDGVDYARKILQSCI